MAQPLVVEKTSAPKSVAEVVALLQRVEAAQAELLAVQATLTRAEERAQASEAREAVLQCQADASASQLASAQVELTAALEAKAAAVASEAELRGKLAAVEVELAFAQLKVRSCLTGVSDWHTFAALRASSLPSICNTWCLSPAWADCSMQIDEGLLVQLQEMGEKFAAADTAAKAHEAAQGGQIAALGDQLAAARTTAAASEAELQR